MKKFLTAYKFAKQFKMYLYWNESMNTWSVIEYTEVRKGVIYATSY